MSGIPRSPSQHDWSRVARCLELSDLAVLACVSNKQEALLTTPCFWSNYFCPELDLGEWLSVLPRWGSAWLRAGGLRIERVRASEQELSPEASDIWSRIPIGELHLKLARLAELDPIKRSILARSNIESLFLSLDEFSRGDEKEREILLSLAPRLNGLVCLCLGEGEARWLTGENKLKLRQLEVQGTNTDWDPSDDETDFNVLTTETLGDLLESQQGQLAELLLVDDPKAYHYDERLWFDITGLSQLKRLRLTDCIGLFPFEDDEYKNRLQARPWPGLTTVELTRCSTLTNDDLRLLFLDGARLRRLVLRECTGLTDGWLARIGPKLAGLEHLDLSGTPVTDTILTDLARLKGLRELHLGRAELLPRRPEDAFYQAFTVQALQRLSELPSSLRVLSLAVRDGNQAAEPLSCLKALTELRLVTQQKLSTRNRKLLQQKLPTFLLGEGEI